MIPRRVMIVRFSSLGDVVLTEPAVAHIAGAWPGAKLGYLTKERCAPLVRSFPARPEVVAVGERETLAAVLKRARRWSPDLVVDLHGSARSRAIAPLLGASVVRVKKRAFWEMVTARVDVRRYKIAGWVVDRATATAERATGTRASRTRPRLEPPQDARDWAGRFLGGLDAGRIAAVAPGALWFTKRWPVESYADVARSLSERGWRVLAVGGEGDVHLCDQVAKAGRGLSSAGEAGVAESVALIERCGVMIGNDSATAHFASAVGVPTATVFGNTIPQFGFAPHWERDAVVEVGELYCRPCHLHGRARCPEGHLRCLRDATVEMVLAAVDRATA